MRTPDQIRSPKTARTFRARRQHPKRPAWIDDTLNGRHWRDL